jgi:hypothetical protein
MRNLADNFDRAGQGDETDRHSPGPCIAATAQGIRTGCPEASRIGPTKS